MKAENITHQGFFRDISLKIETNQLIRNTRLHIIYELLTLMQNNLFYWVYIKNFYTYTP